MDIHILFIQRKESYEGEYAPEALVVWDEFAMEENPEGFDEACAKELKAHGDQVQAHRVFRFHVDGDVIRKKLIGTPTLEATLLED
jgi:hypothetical protein